MGLFFRKDKAGFPWETSFRVPCVKTPSKRVHKNRQGRRDFPIAKGFSKRATAFVGPK